MRIGVVIVAAFVGMGVLGAMPTFAEGRLPERSIRFGVAHITEDAATERVASHVEAEFDVSLDWTRGVGLELGALVEPVRETSSAHPRLFDREDVLLETVALRVAHGPAEVRAGKFAPRFGAASSDAPGPYGTEFAESYELESAWGVEGAAALGTERFGTHRLSVGAWTPDRTFLRTGLFDRAAETDAPGRSGWRIALESRAIPGLEGFETEAAFLRRSGGGRGLAFATGYRLLKLDALVEFAAFTGPNPERYATTSAAVRASGWRASLSYSLRDVGRGGENQVGLALGRRLGDGVYVGLGGRYSPDAGSGGKLELRFGWPRSLRD